LTGVLNLLKPPGMTSFDMVAWARRLLGVKKAGHCGTLDPDAAGVLPVCVGAATGAAGFFLDSRKSYRVEVVTGLLTDTLDISGAVLSGELRPQPPRDRLESALNTFAGVSMQTPPAYSAVKVRGKKLYELARSGVEASAPPRRIEIYSVGVVSYQSDRFIFDIDCSKGTYIRSLCRDLGEKLGVDMCVSFLLRTKSAGLSIEDALTVENITRLAIEGAVENAVIPTDFLLSHYPKAGLADDQYARFMNGGAVRYEPPYTANAGYNACERDVGATNLYAETGAGENIIVRVYRGRAFLGLGTLIPDKSGLYALRVKKFLIERKGQ